MPPDPLLVIETRAWFTKAANDIRAAEHEFTAVPLTEYAWKFRYPGEPEEPPVAEAEDALALARELNEAILSRLPAEVRP
jgi:hypothetical protein